MYEYVQKGGSSIRSWMVFGAARIRMHRSSSHGHIRHARIMVDGGHEANALAGLRVSSELGPDAPGTRPYIEFACFSQRDMLLATIPRLQETHNNTCLPSVSSADSAEMPKTYPN